MLKKVIVAILETRARLKLGDAVRLGRGTTLRHRKIAMKGGCTIRVGERSLIEGTILFDRENARITIGDRTFIGNSTLVCATGISVGNDVLMAWGCTVVDHDSHSIRWEERKGDVVDWIDGRKNWSHVKSAPVVINDKAWIGFNVVILKGVAIGEGAVVAAGSVVTKDVAAWTMVAGNPAKVIREIYAHER